MQCATGVQSCKSCCWVVHAMCCRDTALWVMLLLTCTCNLLQDNSYLGFANFELYMQFVAEAHSAVGSFVAGCICNVLLKYRAHGRLVVELLMQFVTGIHCFGSCCCWVVHAMWCGNTRLWVMLLLNSLCNVSRWYSTLGCAVVKLCMQRVAETQRFESCCWGVVPAAGGRTTSHRAVCFRLCLGVRNVLTSKLRLEIITVLSWISYECVCAVNLI